MVVIKIMWNLLKTMKTIRYAIANRQCGNLVIFTWNRIWITDLSLLNLVFDDEIVSSRSYCRFRFDYWSIKSVSKSFYNFILLCENEKFYARLFFFFFFFFSSNQFQVTLFSKSLIWRNFYENVMADFFRQINL